MFGRSTESLGLPTTGATTTTTTTTTGAGWDRHGTGSRMMRLLTGRRSLQPYGDGSAKSIRVASPAAESWRRSSIGFKRAIWIALICLVSAWMGWRNVRYYNSRVNLTCHSRDCTLVITPSGWTKTITLTLARHQLARVMAVKTLDDGTYQSSNPSLNEDYMYGSKGKYANNKKKSSTYKGPDENGHYVSYSIILKDKSLAGSVLQASMNEAKKSATGGGGGIDDADGDMVPEADLEPILQYCDLSDEPGEYRLTVRKFGIGCSKRRVRAMISKIESYIKHRRQKLIVKESAPPSWTGVLMLVLGLVGFVLSVLVGFFLEEEESYQRAAEKAKQRKHRTMGGGTSHTITTPHGQRKNGLSAAPGASSSTRMGVKSYGGGAGRGGGNTSTAPSSNTRGNNQYAYRRPLSTTTTKATSSSSSSPTNRYDVPTAASLTAVASGQAATSSSSSAMMGRSGSSNTAATTRKRY